MQTTEKSERTVILETLREMVGHHTQLTANARELYRMHATTYQTETAIEAVAKSIVEGMKATAG